ncbi:hypothetical protein BDZ45DRAFT_806581 [Acephala macrosclerotiorum]|nr:hypothetical protein BDZ45DRAFT_806581 [Acephala macrosclerotiorum]
MSAAQMRFRPSAVFPFVSSIIAFALVLALVISGTRPGSIPDGYLLSFNTTSIGSNLVQFSPITPAASATPSTPAVRAVRDVHLALSSLILSRSIIADAPSAAAPNTSISISTNSSSSLSASANTNLTQSATSNSTATTSNAPTLAIPQTAGPINPAAIPISLIGTFFQLALNSFASGMGETLQNIVSLLVTTQKQSLGVNQFYTMHANGICYGSVLNANATNTTSDPFNITSCVSYNDAGSYISNLTSNVSDSTLVAATNITIPALQKVPGVGKQVKSLISLASGIVLAVFVIALMGNAISIILSVAAFILPTNGKVHAIAAGVTTLSTQLLQMAAITSTTIAISVSTSINSFSDVLGLRATVGGKFLALIWFGYIAAQMANGYWMTTWFVKFRMKSFKARMRTPEQMSAGYKHIKAEVLSDLKVTEVMGYDTERTGTFDIKHWN